MSVPAWQLLASTPALLSSGIPPALLPICLFLVPRPLSTLPGTAVQPGHHPIRLRKEEMSWSSVGSGVPWAALEPSGFVGPVPKIIQESPQVSDPHMWASLH